MPIVIDTNTVFPITIRDVTQQWDGLMTAADKIKLDSLTPGGGGTLRDAYTAGDPTENTLPYTDALGPLVVEDATAAGTGNYLGVTYGGSAQELFMVSVYGINMQWDSIGTNTDFGVIKVENPTAAAAGAQQYSPDIRLRGHGWDSGTSSSKTVDFHLQTQPTQSSPASGRFSVSSRIAAGATTQVAYIDSDGNMYLLGGDITSSGVSLTGTTVSGASPAVVVTATGGGSSNWSTSNDYVQFTARVGGSTALVQGFRAGAGTSLIQFYNPSTSGALGQFAGTTTGFEVNTSLSGASDVSYTLGTTSKRWSNVYTAAVTNPDTASSLTLKGFRSNGSTSVANIIDTNATYNTDGAIQTSFRSANTEFAAFERANSAWQLRITDSALATTTVTGLLLQNATAATSGTPTQVSPALALEGTQWNAANKTAGMRLYVDTAYATLASLKIQYKYDSGAYTSVGEIAPGYGGQGVKYSDSGQTAFIEFSSAATGAAGVRIYAGATNVALASANVWGPFNDDATKLGTSALRWTETHSKNYYVGPAGGAGLGSGSGVVSIGNAVTNPSTNPSGGGVLYADAGALKWRGSAGTVTTIAPA